jgi:hypothetical protein
VTARNETHDRSVAPLALVPAGAVGDRGLGEFEGGGEVVEVAVGDRARAGRDLAGEGGQLSDPAGPVVGDGGDVAVEDFDGGAAGAGGAVLFPGPVPTGR